MADEIQQSPQQQTPNTETQPDKARSSGQEYEPKFLNARLKRAEDAARRKLLQELGIEDVNVGKAALAEAKKLRESQMSESEKSQAALQAAEERAKAAENRTLEIEVERKRDLVTSAIRSAAIEARAEHPDDVVGRLTSSLDTLISDDGKVKTEKVKQMIEAVRKERPGWFKSGGVGSPSNAGGRTPDAGGAAKDKALQQLKNQIKRSF